MPGSWRVWRAAYKPTWLQSRFVVLTGFLLVAILSLGCYRYNDIMLGLKLSRSAESRDQNTGHTTTTKETPPRLNIIMSDSRNFSHCQDLNTAQSFCLAVALNFLFAQRHGYGYMFYSYVWNSSAAALLDVPAPRSPAACFHSSSRKARHAAWCKVLVGWVQASAEKKRLSPETFESHLATGPAPEPWTMYVDTDAVFRDWSKGILDYLAEGHNILVGPPLDRAAVAFFSNRPWDADRPNTGTFLFRRGRLAAEFFRYWWAEAPVAGQAWEQSSLWSWYPSKRWELTVSLVDSEQFCGSEDTPGQWIRHYCGVIDVDKEAARWTWLEADVLAAGIDAKAYAAAIQEVSLRHHVRLDVIAADAQISAAVSDSV